jgi:Fur family ferric uptake transcriptional regulator
MDSVPTDQQIGLDAALQRLRRRHQRITPARIAVLSALSITDAHMSAAEIVDLAAVRAPGVHRATVYRALSTLCELGIVTHTHIAGAGTIYHLAEAHGAGHVHLQCSVCGTVIDLPAEALQPLARTVRDDYDFTLEPQHAALMGVCASCR